MALYTRRHLRKSFGPRGVLQLSRKTSSVATHRDQFHRLPTPSVQRPPQWQSMRFCSFRIVFEQNPLFGTRFNIQLIVGFGTASMCHGPYQQGYSQIRIHIGSSTPFPFQGNSRTSFRKLLPIAGCSVWDALAAILGIYVSAPGITLHLSEEKRGEARQSRQRLGYERRASTLKKRIYFTWCPIMVRRR